MPKYITDLAISHDDDDDLPKKGFKRIDVSLNINGSPKVYLWYKEGSSDPITRIQFSFNDSMEKGLDAYGFIKVRKYIYHGTCGDKVSLWFIRRTSESHVPITQIEVARDDDAKKFVCGWERMSCNLKLGNEIFLAFLWVKREKKTYIQNMQITNHSDDDGDYFLNGYIRIDESTNRGTSGNAVFLWYLPTTKVEGCYVALRVSSNEEEYERYLNQGFLPVIPPVNLNEGNQGNKVNLWFKQKDPGQKPIQNITLLPDKDYEKAGVTVCSGNMNSGDGCPPSQLYLGYYN